MISWKSMRIVLIIFCSLILGGLIVLLTQNLLSSHEQEVLRGNILRLNDTNYNFIDPMFACDVGPQEAFPEFKTIKDKLDDFIKQEIKNGNASNISVYLRSLKVGRWFEINGNVNYAPASLLKIFIMMAYFREAEDFPQILDKQTVLEFSKNSSSGLPGGDIPRLIKGKKYSVSQLIEQMIIYSDNDATDTLLNNFDSKTSEFYRNIFSDLNIPLPNKPGDDFFNFMSVFSYSMGFRVLFSATYLNREYSERALELLSRAQYKDGIVAGVPSDIIVAHKFGVRAVPQLSITEFHDCGIIYYPNHPYLLCIMTRGSDFNLLQNAARDISVATYRELNNFFSHL